MPKTRGMVTGVILAMAGNGAVAGISSGEMTVAENVNRSQRAASRNDPDLPMVSGSMVEARFR
jgi:hypothetical protein